MKRRTKGYVLASRFAAYGTSQTASHSSSSEEVRFFTLQTTFRMTALFFSSAVQVLLSILEGSANRHLSVPYKRVPYSFTYCTAKLLIAPLIRLSTRQSIGYGEVTRFGTTLLQNCTASYGTPFRAIPSAINKVRDSYRKTGGRGW